MAYCLYKNIFKQSKRMKILPFGQSNNNKKNESRKVLKMAAYTISSLFIMHCVYTLFSTLCSVVYIVNILSNKHTAQSILYWRNNMFGSMPLTLNITQTHTLTLERFCLPCFANSTPWDSFNFATFQTEDE